MNTDTKNFLNNLLFDTQCGQNDSETPFTEEESIQGCTIEDFSPEFVRAVEGFIDGFISFLNKEEFDTDRLMYLDRSFGANVYCSLSGMGVGFFDEYSDPDKTLGDELTNLIKEYSGNNYRFEELAYSLSKNEKGKIDLAFIPSAIDEYRNKMFKVTDATNPADLSA